MLPICRVHPAKLELIMSLVEAGVLEHVLPPVALWKQSGWHYINRDEIKLQKKKKRGGGELTELLLHMQPYNLLSLNSPNAAQSCNVPHVPRAYRFGCPAITTDLAMKAGLYSLLSCFLQQRFECQFFF